jgi:hypothetical protein
MQESAPRPCTGMRKDAATFLGMSDSAPSARIRIITKEGSEKN